VGLTVSFALVAVALWPQQEPLTTLESLEHLKATDKEFSSCFADLKGVGMQHVLDVDRNCGDLYTATACTASCKQSAIGLSQYMGCCWQTLITGFTNVEPNAAHAWHTWATNLQNICGVSIAGQCEAQAFGVQKRSAQHALQVAQDTIESAKTEEAKAREAADRAQEAGAMSKTLQAEMEEEKEDFTKLKAEFKESKADAARAVVVERLVHRGVKKDLQSAWGLHKQLRRDRHNAVLANEGTARVQKNANKLLSNAHNAGVAARHLAHWAIHAKHQAWKLHKIARSDAHYAVLLHHHLKAEKAAALAAIKAAEQAEDEAVEIAKQSAAARARWAKRWKGRQARWNARFHKQSAAWRARMKKRSAAMRAKWHSRFHKYSAQLHTRGAAWRAKMKKKWAHMRNQSKRWRAKAADAWSGLEKGEEEWANKAKGVWGDLEDGEKKVKDGEAGQEAEWLSDEEKAKKAAAEEERIRKMVEEGTENAEGELKNFNEYLSTVEVAAQRAEMTGKHVQQIEEEGRELLNEEYHQAALLNAAQKNVAHQSAAVMAGRQGVAALEGEVQVLRQKFLNLRNSIEDAQERARATHLAPQIHVHYVLPMPPRHRSHVTVRHHMEERTPLIHHIEDHSISFKQPEGSELAEMPQGNGELEPRVENIQPHLSESEQVASNSQAQPSRVQEGHMEQAVDAARAADRALRGMGM